MLANITDNDNLIKMLSSLEKKFSFVILVARQALTVLLMAIAL